MQLVSSSPSAEKPPFWSLKPWWCQPWSILLTGSGSVLGSWFWPHRLWVTLPIAVVILTWWALFLILVPTAYQNGTLDVTE